MPEKRQSLRVVLAKQKRDREAIAKQAEVSRLDSELKQSEYNDFTAVFDAVYELGIELIGRPKRNLRINKSDVLTWAKRWKCAADHLNDKMKTALSRPRLTEMPQLLGTTVQVLLSSTTEPIKVLREELGALINDPEVCNFIEWLPWLKDELYPPILVFSARHQCFRVPEHAGMPFWLSPDEYFDPKFASLFAHGEANVSREDLRESDSRNVPLKTAKDTDKKLSAVNAEAGTTWPTNLRQILPKLKGKQRRVLEMLIEAGGRVAVTEVATDKSISWLAPYKSAIDGIKRELNEKLIPLKTSLRVFDDHLELVQKAARKKAKTAQHK